MQKPIIISESEKLRVIYLPGDSDHLLVTFAPLNYRPSNRNAFWGDIFAQKAGIATLGFVVKGEGNWYPDQEMDAVLPAIADILTRHGEIITYGTSMGGYAALKHAGKLGASTALAFSPQWSIDPAYIPFRYALTSFYDPAVNGAMNIRSEDMCDNGYVFYDDRLPQDLFQAQQISATHPAIHLIEAPNTGHQTVTLFASTAIATDMIRMARQRDVHGLRRLCGIRRKSSGVRLYNLAMLAATRRPALAETILATYGDKIANLQRRLADEAIGDGWWRQKDVEKARAAYHRAIDGMGASTKSKYANLMKRCTIKIERELR